MSSIVLSGDTSGTVTVAVPAVAGTNTVTIPAKTGNAMIDGPAFFAYPNSNTTISSGVNTVVANNTEVFDTANCYNNTGSTVSGIPAYSFLPNVPGYYLLTVTCDNEASTLPSRFILNVQQNGNSYRVGDNFTASPSVMTGSVLLYFNGTTDYVNMAIYIAATTPRYNGDISTTRFSGYLVRGA